jgi:hypothetical protein
MASVSKRNSQVEAALEMLRSGRAGTVADAARESGAPRTTVRDRWDREQRGIPHVDDQLTEIPDEPTGGEIPVFVRDYSHLPDLHTYPLGDLHIGAPQFAEAAFDEWVSYLVGTKGVSMLGTGDFLNCALSTSVSDEYSEKLPVRDARRLFTEKVRPLAEADKLDCLIDGNHEMRVWRSTGDSPIAAVADGFGVPYSMAALVVRYLVGDESYDVYLRHGTGGGSTMGAAVNRLERQERIIDADIYVSGHTHTQVAFPKNIFVPNGRGGFSRRKRLFVCSGSFLAYEDYAAAAGLPPAHIGAPRIYMSGSRHDMHASV